MKGMELEPEATEAGRATAKGDSDSGAGDGEGSLKKNLFTMDV